MTEDTLHEHRCACGTVWSCRQTDCFWGDCCDACEDAALSMWFESHGQTEYQPPLEPEAALLGEDS